MHQVELFPELSHCIETVAKDEYRETLCQLLLGSEGNEELEEKVGLLRVFLRQWTSRSYEGSLRNICCREEGQDSQSIAEVDPLKTTCGSGKITEAGGSGATRRVDGGAWSSLLPESMPHMLPQAPVHIGSLGHKQPPLCQLGYTALCSRSRVSRCYRARRHLSRHHAELLIQWRFLRHGHRCRYRIPRQEPHRKGTSNSRHQSSSSLPWGYRCSQY